MILLTREEQAKLQKIEEKYKDKYFVSGLVKIFYEKQDLIDYTNETQPKTFVEIKEVLVRGKIHFVAKTLTLGDWEKFND